MGKIETCHIIEFVDAQNIQRAELPRYGIMKLMDNIRNTLLLLCTVYLIGCASTGKKIDVTKVEQIQKGMSRDQVRSLIGAPDAVTKDLDGVEQWVYRHAEAKVDGKIWIPYAGPWLAKTTVKHETVTITYDGEGKVATMVTETGETESRNTDAAKRTAEK